MGESLWLLALTRGASSTLIYTAFGLLALKGYRSHGYLYRFDFSKKNLNQWIDIFMPIAKKIKHKRYRALLETKMPQAGINPAWKVDHFIALQIFVAAIAFVSVFLFFFILLGASIVIPFIAGIAMFFLPLLKIIETASARVSSCRKDLSYFLDYLSLSMAAGMDFNQALNVVIESAPKSVLREEFNAVNRQLKLGKTRIDALLEFEERMATQETKIFVQNLVQALSLGTNVSETLLTISQSLSTKRFQRAEEEAGKISVRMMVPMLGFILPVVIAMIVGPMLLAFINA
ncbi:MAG: type II secretion system F family protein [Pseudobacteriovorax sp.]|nr:type II secretion system F family protein [Pseudobacteriovorax sp.]